MVLRFLDGAGLRVGEHCAENHEGEDHSKAEAEFLSECKFHFVLFSLILKLEITTSRISHRHEIDQALIESVCRYLPLASGRGGFTGCGHLTGFIDVEHMHEPVVEFVDTQDHGADRSAQSLGRWLEG